MPLWVALLLIVLILPLIGALLTLALGRILPKRSGLLLAALALFLAMVTIVVLVPLIQPYQDLAETISPPSTSIALLIAPTAPWVQPPRTLTIPTIVTPTIMPTPTLGQAATTPSPTPHPYSLVTIVVRNGTGETGLATRTSKTLAQRGFRVLTPEDDPQQGSRPQTLVLDRGDHAEVRKALVDFLHVPAEHVQINSAESSSGDIIVILGDDFDSLANATPAPTPTLVGGPTATPNPYAGVTITVRNGTVGRSGLATRTTDRLKTQGFIVLSTTDDDRAGERPHTLIFDRGDHTAVREALIQFLKVDPGYVEVNSREYSDTDIIIILGDDFQE